MDKSLGRVLFIGAIWLYSLIYCLQCNRLKDMSDKLLIIVVFCILTVFVIVEMVRLFREYKNKEDRVPFGLNAKAIIRDKKTLLIIALTAYLLIMPFIGYYSASFISFCLFSYILGNRGFVKIVIPGIIVVTAIHLIFVVTLKLTLPQGLFI